MDKVSGKLTVFFENPFWVGVFEMVCNGRMFVSKTVFGGEPKDAEVYAFILKNYNRLSYGVFPSEEIREKRMNPKKLKRKIKAELEKSGTGTKSQQALKKMLEEKKNSAKVRRRADKEAEEQKKFDLKQKKKKEKHKGH